MKKTLLALAVLAASGAAFAQSATLSGSYAAGFQSSNIGGTKKAGFGTDTAGIALVATEDLGGGLKATAKVSLGGMMRDGSGTGEDAFVSLSGGFGTIMLGTVESDDGLSRAYAGAPVIGLDGKVHGGNANIDVIGYTSPQLIPGLTVGFSYVDRGNQAVAGNLDSTKGLIVVPVGSTGTGLNVGTTGATGAQPSATLNVTYGAGPISARFDVTQWTRKGQADVSGAVLNNRFRISGNYAFGPAKVGLGYSSLKRTTAVTTTQLEAGVSASFGPATVGAVYEIAKTTGTADKSGFTVGAQYNLSKRTNVSVGYAAWKAKGAATTDNTFRVLVGHSF